MPVITEPLLFFGGGNMATAIISGAAAAGAIDPTRILVADPGIAGKGDLLALGVEGHAEAEKAAERLRALESDAGVPGQIILAIKPQILPELAPTLPGLIGERRRVVITMLAGVPSETVQEAAGGAAGVIRVMPNTPASIRRGMTAISKGAGAEPGDAAVAERLFASIGQVLAIDESQIDAFTGVAGSGPAYLFRFVEALTSAAEEVGFEPKDAETMARQTVIGAAMLLASSGEPAGDLRAKVTSKKGTTAAGLDALESGGMAEAIRAAVFAARDRGSALAELARSGG